MATIYADANGEIIRYLQTDADVALMGEPAAYAHRLEFDPHTNPRIVQGLSGQIEGVLWQDIRLIDGVLTYKGKPVLIESYGPEWLLADRAARSYTDAANVPEWATWTKAEAAAWYGANVTALVTAIPDITAMTQTAFTNNAKAICAQFQDIIAAQATVIRNLALMVIALRNKTWPNLEGQ